MAELQFHTMPDGRKIAYRHVAGREPCLVFLPGYMSDMSGSKASAVLAAASARGQACLLLDYSGCGHSSGDFADGTLTRWREEVAALIQATTRQPILLIGSSMGGWLMLLVAEQLGAQLAAMVGIAAAPDFTRWGYSQEQRARLEKGGIVLEDNPYGSEPTPTYPGLYRDARDHLCLDQPIALDVPVRLLHGQGDTDVPWHISQKLAEALESQDVQLTLIKDGDHRLSREGDIAVLLSAITALSDRVASGRTSP